MTLYWLFFGLPGATQVAVVVVGGLVASVAVVAVVVLVLGLAMLVSR